MVLFVKCYVVFHFLMFYFQQVYMFKIIQLSLGNRVVTILGKKVASSACHLSILWLLNCIFLPFPLVLGVRCVPVPELTYSLCLK